MDGWTSRVTTRRFVDADYDPKGWLHRLASWAVAGIIANMTAELITRLKDVTPEGDLIEFVVWRLPEPIPPCGHPFKYRLVFVVAGEHVIGFDNERGKGDHWHLCDIERPYAFVDVDRLIEDFIGEVERWRHAH